jgi:hypothetical protein
MLTPRYFTRTLIAGQRDIRYGRHLIVSIAPRQWSWRWMMTTAAGHRCQHIDVEGCRSQIVPQQRRWPTTVVVILSEVYVTCSTPAASWGHGRHLVAIVRTWRTSPPVPTLRALGVNADRHQVHQLIGSRREQKS